MHKYKLNWLGLLSLSVIAPCAHSAERVTPEAWLLEQIRIGEATHKDDLVKESLYRLESITPNNPDVMGARMRYLMRQGKLNQAKQLLDQLGKLAPNSEAYRTAQLNYLLSQPQGRQKLQQARLLSTGGQLEKAKAAYDELFNGDFPTVDLALEYWRLVARLPNQEKTAEAKLEALNKRYPNSPDVQQALARTYFSQDRYAKGFDMLALMAKDSQGRDNASNMWQEKLKAMPVGPESVAMWQRYLTLFSDGPQVLAARQELERQKTLLADPAYRARSSGLAKLDKGQNRGAIGDLQTALKNTPNDAEVLGALGQAYSRSGLKAKALALFERAKKADTEGESGDKWDSLIQSTRYWLLISAGDAALKAQNLAQASKLYRQARRVDNTDSSAVVGLGDVAVAQKNDPEAERYYQQALRLEPDSGSATRGLVGVYQRQSPQKALDYLSHLSRQRQKEMRGTLESIKVDMLKDEAEQLIAKQQWAEAERKLREAQPMAKDDIWLVYRLARTLQEQKRLSEGDAAFAHFRMQNFGNKPVDQQYVYAYALYLSGSDRDDLALDTLASLPKTQWDDNMREMSQRLTLQRLVDRAQKMRDGGDEAGAIALLKQQPANTQLDLVLADWALQREDNAEALAEYRKILAKEPHNEDALLGQVEALLADGQDEAAREQLTNAGIEVKPDAMGAGRRLANAWQMIGDSQQAEKIFAVLKPAAKGVRSQDSAWLLRDAARVERAAGNPTQALEDYRGAMYAGGISPTAKLDDETFTRYTRNNPTDDWLTRSIRADAADLYRQQTTTITMDYDYWGSSGTPGYSDLKAMTAMFHAETPLYDGRLFFRTDGVDMNPGSFKHDSNGVFSEDFGTCEVGCVGNSNQKARGASVAVGWFNDRWNMDIGTTPMGFDVVDVVGGLSYDFDWQNIGWTLHGSRRPISSSVLSFSGAKDPLTGKTWGGVRATGGGIGASYDSGGDHGVWSDLSAHSLTGKNVPDNQRMRFMAGYYYKLINEDNRRVSVGLNTMLWHYQKDLSGYTLGQGGYYSPQKYLSFAVPVNYRERTTNWSWEINGAVSWSHSSTNDSSRYPIKGLLPSYDQLCIQYNTCDVEEDAYNTVVNSKSKGSSSSGFGYTARAIVERRLDSHWTLGAGVDIQQAKDYAPSHALLYLRYSFSPWQGDLDMPPKPLTPYADFK